MESKPLAKGPQSQLKKNMELIDRRPKDRRKSIVRDIHISARWDGFAVVKELDEP